MTTIAYRDGVLAADTLLTSSAMRNGYARKIRERDGMLAGASGTLAQMQTFLDWFDAGMTGDPPSMAFDKENCAEALVIISHSEAMGYFENGV
jgi:hypothetical protein